MTLFVLALVIFLVSLGGTRLALWLLRRHQVMDKPNARSNHTLPTPRGGGVAVIAAMISGAAVLWLLGYDIQPGIPLLYGIALLTPISFYDDIKGASIRWRFLCQLLAVSITLSLFPLPGLLFGGALPAFLERVIAALGLLWFINLYNFMDGIDGITGSETAAISIGVALVALAAGLPSFLSLYPLIIVASILGFLVWNWHPARIFIGDVGSVTLGYVTGWLLLQLAAAGYLAAALILPAYYLTDSSVTLIKRMIRGERFWESHSQHFYQQAVRSGYNHAQVTRGITYINIILIITALISTHGGGYALASLTIAYSSVAGLVYYWHRQKHPLTKK